MPKTGAFISFADPALSAREANIFWCLDSKRKTISAYVRSGAGHQNPGGLFSLGDVSCRAALLKTPRRGQHLMLHDQNRVSHILCKGGDIRGNPLSIELVIGDFLNIEYHFRKIRKFVDLCRGPPVPNPKRDRKADWTVEATRHRDALAALDKRMADWSYREIAVFLYGRRAVQEDWNNPGQTMKNRLIRSVKRGFRLRDGGYKTLIH